jgi:predicted nucleic acid-binding protein
MADRTQVVVDTDVLIDYFAGVTPSAEAVVRLLGEDRLATTTLTLFELACGAQTPEQLQDIELLLQATHLLTLDAPAALRAGAVYRELRERGELLGTADLLIAGCCLAEELPLLTRNIEHFSRVRGLALLTAESLLETEG